MTVAAPKAPTRAAPPARRPAVIVVDRHELVGEVMDWQTLAREALFANGATLELLMALGRGAALEAAVASTHDTHARLSQLIADLREAAGILDGRPT